MSELEFGLALGGADSLALARRAHGAVVTGSVPIDPITRYPMIDAMEPFVRPLAGHTDIVGLVIEDDEEDPKAALKLATFMVQLLSMDGISVQDPDFLRRSLIEQALRVGGGPGDSPSFRAAARQRGARHDVPLAEAVAVLLTMPPACVWDKDFRASTAARTDEALEVPRARELLSPAEVSLIYGVSRSYAYALRRFIRCYRFGGVKYRKADIESFLERDRRIVPQGGGDDPVVREPPARRRGRRSALDDQERNEALKTRYGF